MIFDFLNYFKDIIISLSLEHQILAYLFLFIIVFIENGLFFVPFLPGDSLFFLSGAIFSYVSFSEIFLLFLLVSLAAILGDTVNYLIGKFLGKEILKRHWINYSYIKKTEQYFVDYGEKTILLARFIPIVRTFAPFIAGIGRMDFTSFTIYNIAGGVMWVFIFLFGGYFFGNIPFIQENLTLLIIIMVLVSIIPIINFIYKEYKKKSK